MQMVEQSSVSNPLSSRQEQVEDESLYFGLKHQEFKIKKKKKKIREREREMLQGGLRWRQLDFGVGMDLYFNAAWFRINTEGYGPSRFVFVFIFLANPLVLLGPEKHKSKIRPSPSAPDSGHKARAWGRIPLAPARRRRISTNPRAVVTVLDMRSHDMIFSGVERVGGVLHTRGPRPWEVILFWRGRAERKGTGKYLRGVPNGTRGTVTSAK